MLHLISRLYSCPAKTEGLYNCITIPLALVERVTSKIIKQYDTKWLRYYQPAGTYSPQRQRRRERVTDVHYVRVYVLVKHVQVHFTFCLFEI